MTRRRRRKSLVRKVLHDMAPHRVLWRAMSGPEVKRAVKGAAGTRTVRVNAKTRQAEVKRTQKKTAAKTVGKRPDPYAAAKAIPAQNRAVAAKAAQAQARGLPAKKQVPVRGPGGRFDGSKVMTDEERGMYLAARKRAESPPPGQRWTGTRGTPQ